MKASKESIAKRLAALQADNEGDPTRTLGRGAEGRANALAFARAVRGRPAKGKKAVGTATRSLRFTNDVWERLEAEAARRKLTLHAFLRVIVAEFLFTHPTHETASTRASATKRARKRA